MTAIARPRRMTTRLAAVLVAFATITGATSIAPPDARAATASGDILRRQGDTGNMVRDLQVRLRLLSFPSGTIDGVYDSGVTTALGGFLAKYGYEGDGRVLRQAPWSKIVSLTATPTILRQGSSGAYVKELQGRLKIVGYWPYSVNGTYGSTLTSKVLAFQRAKNLPHSRVYDQRTRDRLLALTYNPKRFDVARFNAGLKPFMPKVSSLDWRCRTGRVLCASKNSRVLTWVVNGVPKARVWARYGGSSYPTREGTFSVYRKKVDVTSNIYGTPMPYSMFFSGGQAVHYSSNFARMGYTSSSHGCINVKDMDTLKKIYYDVRIGDKVVVYK